MYRCRRNFEPWGLFSLCSPWPPGQALRKEESLKALQESKERLAAKKTAGVAAEAASFAAKQAINEEHAVLRRIVAELWTQELAHSVQFAAELRSAGVTIPAPNPRVLTPGQALRKEELVAALAESKQRWHRRPWERPKLSSLPRRQAAERLSRS